MASSFLDGEGGDYDTRGHGSNGDNDTQKIIKKGENKINVVLFLRCCDESRPVVDDLP